jgi:hypothetical protein
MPEIILDLITTPDGGELFVPSVDRVQKAKRRADAKVAELRRVAAEMQGAIDNPPKGADPEELEIERQAKLDEADAIEADILATVSANETIREKYGHSIQQATYPFRPYTDGEKTDALSEATDYSGSTPRLDPNKYHRILVAACTGLSPQEVRAMSPARAEALTREVIDRSEPDPSRLDFLF